MMMPGTDAGDEQLAHVDVGEAGEDHGEGVGRDQRIDRTHAP